ncbi:50S ribosomal protein L25/general stress protein Ctc [Salinibacterium sp. SYSU T00001]|uniref:50S ribosomal protein L25/general stress protein Ctc n=1 Tax=Homoserinimonas sedimenticola TaxID=2986805 RepID=UPI002236B550|nr:50S ribosomal protein L25/general stress protein Ctc [Salinibacterium sedimenticola]MCW4386416.1 50S ribosomal protein L25/general stress protein Ctc [Salinibacterium sedimenticola]
MGEKTSRAGRPSVASTTEISNHIVAEVRENFGKGYARRLRAAHKIPAVLYGHGTAPQHLALPGHETALLLRKANAILELEINGKTQTGLVKDVQKDPVRQLIEHVDLIVIRKGEKVEVEVPVHVVGEPASGTVLEQDAHTILVEAPAIHIPDSVEVSVEGREAVSHVYASEISLPKDVSLVADPETLIVSVVVPAVAPEPEAEGESEAVEEAPAEEAAE